MEFVYDFCGFGVASWTENRSKIVLKMMSTWEGILAPIFLGFWWVWGAKLGGKMEPRSIQNGIEKTIPFIMDLVRA